MPTELLPRPAPDGSVDLDDPIAVVEAFLAAAADGDAALAASFVADDILYVNVGLPAIRGLREVEKVLHMMDRPGAGFEVYLHATSAEGPVVLTERTDVLLIGRARIQFWVWGRFEVRDGKIVLWRDSFDFLDVLRGTVRGLLGVVFPVLRPRPPAHMDIPPGR